MMVKKILRVLLLSCIMSVSAILCSEDFNLNIGEPKNDKTTILEIENVKKVHETFISGVKGSKDRYIRNLKALMDIEQKKGSLEGVEELKLEIDAMSDTSIVDSRTEFNNPTAKKGQETYRKEIEILRSKYLIELQRVQAEEVKVGKIENAKKIRAYIENIQDEYGTVIGGKESTDAKNNSSSIKFAKIQLIPPSEIPSKQKKSISKHVDKVSATSSYDEKYKSDFACDGKEDTEWALKGNIGSIEMQLKKNIAIKVLMIMGRKGDDFIRKGKVIINSKYEFPFSNFSSGNILTLSWTQPITGIQNIKVESIEGSGNPGIIEIYTIDK